MRKTLLALFSTALGMAALIGLKVQSAGAPRSALAGSGGSGSGTAASPGGRAPSAAPTGPAAKPTGRYTGTPQDTPYGTVQVRAVVDRGRLTEVVVLQRTSGGRSTQIDSYALPILRTEALRAQGARIDVVSGATYTSRGYARSLQSALDAERR